MAGIVIVPDWVSDLAEHYADEVSGGCPVAVAIERAVVDALARPPAVLALPPEPPVGTVVGFASAPQTRYRCEAEPDGAQHPTVWRRTRSQESGLLWSELLHVAGPEGVRVVGGG